MAETKTTTVKPAAKKSIVEIKKRAKLWFKPDSSIKIRFLSTYFRDEVDILAVLWYKPSTKGNWNIE